VQEIAKEASTSDVHCAYCAINTSDFSYNSGYIAKSNAPIYNIHGETRLKTLTSTAQYYGVACGLHGVF